jgi:HK97 family phage major capsid protein
VAEITRADALALISEQDMGELWQDAAKQSLAMQTFRRVTMTKKQAKVRVLDALPAAPGGGAWIDGDTGRKPTLDMGWANKFLEAEEIAGIVPIPENVLDDADMDIWGEVRPRIAEYVGYHLDLAVLLGVGAPASFGDSLYEGAVAAGNVLDYSTFDALGTQAEGYDLAGAWSETIGLVEDDGYNANAIWTKRAEKRRLQNLRDGDGNPILGTNMRSDSNTAVPSIWGVDTFLAENAALNAVATLHGIVGDRSRAVLGIRQDIEFKFLSEATLTDGEGKVLVSLAEQDMIALRFKMRAGFTVADPMTWEGGSGAYPFAVLVA